MNVCAGCNQCGEEQNIFTWLDVKAEELVSTIDLLTLRRTSNPQAPVTVNNKIEDIATCSNRLSFHLYPLTNSITTRSLLTILHRPHEGRS